MTPWRTREREEREEVGNGLTQSQGVLDDTLEDKREGRGGTEWARG